MPRRINGKALLRWRFPGTNLWKTCENIVVSLRKPFDDVGVTPPIGVVLYAGGRGYGAPTAAIAPISISHSGSASALTTTSVEAGWGEGRMRSRTSRKAAMNCASVM